MAFDMLFTPKIEVADGCKHIVCFSGGETSALVALEVAERYGTAKLVLLNHNIVTRSEDADIKRFKREIAAYIGVPVTYANMVGWATKDQFDVVVEAGALTSQTGMALCTNRMKTQPFDRWLSANVPDKNCILYYGFTSDEQRRIRRRAQILGIRGYKTDFPLATWTCTFVSTTDVGIVPPLVYAQFKHANCVGCLKAGAQHWYVVYCTRQDVWVKAIAMEEELGRTILKEQALADLECKFEAMRRAGVPATERVTSSKFWSAAKAVVGNYFQQEDIRPCECVW